MCAHTIERIRAILSALFAASLKQHTSSMLCGITLPILQHSNKHEMVTFFA